MRRIKRNESEIRALVSDYESKAHRQSKREYCKSVSIAPSVFYRYLSRYGSIPERAKPIRRASAKIDRQRAGQFVELKPARDNKKADSSYRLVLRLFGIKLFKLELEHV